MSARMPVHESRRKDFAQAAFEALARWWREETRFQSSLHAMTEHPAYCAIIALGPEMVPLLLAELERSTDFWFVALHQLTGADPVQPHERGHVEAMRQAWIQWGREHC